MNERKKEGRKEKTGRLPTTKDHQFNLELEVELEVVVW